LFFISPGYIAVVPGEIKDNAYAKFWGAKKVHYGRFVYISIFERKFTKLLYPQL